jgi:hypothetical protein
MFKQRYKKRKPLSSCSHPKHVFPKNKGKCLCGYYYKDNGRILREKGASFVAGTTADFNYSGKHPTKRSLKRKIKAMLRK